MYLNLSLFFSIRFLLTAICVSLPIPAGIYTPLFTLGAALGRIFGEMMLAMYPSSGIVPGRLVPDLITKYYIELCS